jgi:hypothetical protein
LEGTGAMHTESPDVKITLGELYEFIIANKGTRTFMGLSDDQIKGMLIIGLRDNMMLVALDSNNKISGTLLAAKDVEKKILFITENLAMNMANLRMFAKIAKQRFIGYKMEAIRQGGYRKFNTDKLYNKLTRS